jgi:hypothetical protein
MFFFYGIRTNPPNNIITFTYLGGGCDRILYPQYLSGIVLGVQEEDCPGPENTSTPVLYHRVLPSVLPDYEPDSRRQYTARLFGLPLLYHTRSVQQTLGHADPRLHRRNGIGTVATADYSQNLKINGEGCTGGESEILVEVSLGWRL